MSYFNTKEFACHHCGKNLIHADFVGKLEQLRAKYGQPLIVSSGYRCPDHNAAVSSTGRVGPHTTGRAADFAIQKDAALVLLMLALDTRLFTGVGIQQKGVGRFIHLDDLPNAPGQPRPTIWSY